jgi:hypothetical protein
LFESFPATKISIARKTWVLHINNCNIMFIQNSR